MSAAAPGRSPTILQHLIAQAGHIADSKIDKFGHLAVGVQHQRHRDKGSDTTRITRSTALWTVMYMDVELRRALESGGVDHERLGDMLSIAGVPHPDDRPAILYESLDVALREYLAALPERQLVGLADVAAAIIQAGNTDAHGLLPGRLGKLGVRYEKVIPALNRILPISHRRFTGPTKPPELSRTMRAVADEWTQGRTQAVVTAFDIADAIGRRHPEYAGGRLGNVELIAPFESKSLPWPTWFRDVAGLYDRDVVAATSHEILDGRLFLVALCNLDPPLRRFLETTSVWGPLVLEVDDAVAPPGSPLSSLLHGVQFAYGYHSDQVGGDDQLGVQGEVNAMCEVIIDPEVSPPLAVGLFGEWGSGKSFFMEKMRERIAMRTTRSAPGDEHGQLNVVQIRFNAWHYADTSLWASLAIEIFERLIDPEPVKQAAHDRWLRDHGDRGRHERQELLAQLQTYRDAKAELDDKHSRLELKRDAVVTQRKKARDRQRLEIKKTPLTDVAAELAKDPEVRAAVARVATEFGVEPAVEDLTSLGADLRTSGGYLVAVWRLVRGKTWIAALAALFVVLTLVTVILVLSGGWGWLASVATAATSVGAVTTAVGKARPAARKVNSTLQRVEDAIRTVAAVRARMESERDQEQRLLDLTLAQLDREITEATHAITVLDKEIAETTAAAEALTVGKRLYDFLTDRALGYQKHQGVVGMLHRDFRFLDAQLRAHRADRESLSWLPRIDRVVLYVDDLDRCPPAKVLEVLEAVHLLLALKLFVVVVGVDPRWLQRSLRHQYRDLMTSGEARSDPYLRSMPIEYLEKIFQIPFTLPAMTPRGYAQLVASLEPAMAPASPPEDMPTSMPVHRVVAGEAAEGRRTPARAKLDVQPGSSAAGDPGQRIHLTGPETEFAMRLGTLVNSPRAAKRLMNTYRLLRATRHVGRRSRFLGSKQQPGEYQAALTLLAVAAGFPATVNRLLVALEDAPRQAIQSWPDFVRELGPGGSLVPAQLIEGSLDGATDNELAEWQNLHEALTTSLESNGLVELEPYQRWGPVVARFSFTV